MQTNVANWDNQLVNYDDIAQQPWNNIFIQTASLNTLIFLCKEILL